MPSTSRLIPILLTVALFSAGCVLPDELPETSLPVRTLAPVVQPEQCLGDGAVQSWQLLPQDPLESELMAAYGQGQIVEFQAAVVGSSEDPADLPHRSFFLAEAAEGITLTLRYLGDPPPLMLGQDYRLVAWIDQGFSIYGYELQAFDPFGLLFLGATDADLAGDPLGIQIEEVAGDCLAVLVPQPDCAAQRQVVPLRVRWGEEEVLLYPGEDAQIVHGGQLYQVSLYRSRRVLPAESACPDWFEHRRSLRIERLQPPPMMPIVPSGTLSATVPITGGLPFTGSVPAATPAP